jgi:hypothetical protein
MPRAPASTTFTADVPGTLGHILSNAGYTARLVVERRDGAALTAHQVRALAALLATTAGEAPRRARAAARPSAGAELARRVEAVLAMGVPKPRRSKARTAPRPAAAHAARVRTKPAARGQVGTTQSRVPPRPRTA